jgi:hypothetical protein
MRLFVTALSLDANLVLTNFTVLVSHGITSAAVRTCVCVRLSIYAHVVNYGVAVGVALRQVGCTSSSVERIDGPSDSEVSDIVIQGRIRDGWTHRTDHNRVRIE